MISVIIPTLNEAAYISECILNVVNSAEKVPEIIVVDAGSQDDTLDLVSIYPEVKVYQDEKLKGEKYASLNAGASRVLGDIFVFLDADTRLPQSFDRLIESQILNNGAAGGAFEMKFDENYFFLNFVRLVNSIRYRLSKRCFGDQAIFCTKTVFNMVGGYPNKPILEAAHFCDKLKKKGKFKLIKQPVITSGRRFIEGGVLRVFIRDCYLILLDNLGFDLTKEGKRYWNQNNAQLQKE